MEVTFLKDFRGKETNEFFYKAGEVAAVKDHHAARLIELGFAEEYVAPGAAQPDPVVIAAPEIVQTDVSIFAQPELEEERPVQPFEVEEPAKPKRKPKAKK